MLTPTAVTKPVMTELGTKRSSTPPRRSPAAIMTTPVRAASVQSARSGSGRDPRSASATTSDMAPVAWTAMSVLLVKSARPTMP